MGRLSTIQPVPTTDEPWRVTAVAPGPRGRWSTCTDHHRTYLEALGQAKRLAWEAQPAGGAIHYAKSSRQAIEGYVVGDAEEELCALILIWRTKEAASPDANEGAPDAAA